MYFEPAAFFYGEIANPQTPSPLWIAPLDCSGSPGPLW
jgi:hypothetical protein